MHLLASLVTLFTLSLLTLSASAQLNQEFSSSSSITVHTTPNIVRGTVLNAAGRPASDVHIELDQDGTAIPVTSTYTEEDGAFELYNIPGGSYELVAESKDARIDQHVQLQSGESQVELRLPHNTSAIREAVPTVSVAQMMVPESAQKLLRKALTAFEHGKYDKSKSLLDCALQIDPQYAEALTLRGSIEMSQGDLSGAQQDLERAVQADPNYSGAYVELGAIYNHQGRFDDAARVSERSLTLSPRSWQGYFEMAKAAIGKGMYEKGLQLAARAQRLSGNSFASVHLIKAYALLPLRFYKDARYELRAFLAREPNSSNAKQAQMLLAEIDSMPATAATAP
jgi:tetratricopeptide (TPR) repeat protein